MHGMDTSDPAQPKIVHAFMPRDTAGYTIKETWDVLGMRATRSDDTVSGQCVCSRSLHCPGRPGRRGGNRFFRTRVFAWALMGFGNVYYGLAKRALDQTIAAVKSKGSLALTRSMAYHPEIQHAIADMVIELESIGPHLERSLRTGRTALIMARHGRQKSLPRNIARSKAPGVSWIWDWM